jgi:hypothetical protein
MNSVVPLHYDFALFAIAYMLILIGNLQGTTLAYQGMLMYVFMTFFSADPLSSKWLFEFRIFERQFRGHSSYLFMVFFSML